MTQPPESGDRVTNRQLYDALGALEQRFATKENVRTWILAGLLGGQVVASAITALVTRLSPPEQAHAVAAWLASTIQ